MGRSRGSPQVGGRSGGWLVLSCRGLFPLVLTVFGINSDRFDSRLSGKGFLSLYFEELARLSYFYAMNNIVNNFKFSFV